MATIREQIQDGQHLANLTMTKIINEIITRDLKYIAVQTFKEELETQLEQHFESLKPKHHE